MTLANAGPPYEQLKGLFRDLSGTDFAVYWSDEGRAVSVHGFIELHEISVISIGIDEQRRTYNAQTDKQQTSILGNRKWTVQCRIGVFLPPKQLRAATVMEKLKLRLGKPIGYQRYQDWGLSLIDWGTTISQPLQQDTRMISSATCDFVFGFRNVDTDTVDDDSGFIQTVDNGSFAGKGTFNP